ncbi:MAG TPA: hypothetical protein VK149_06285 [Sideroxyarcus sp.]|nr:hypothetical protein [Sideroxyarcus sp.]
MTIVMNMSGYEIEREEVAVERYGDEVMQAGWNPQLSLASAYPTARIERRPALPAGLENVDVDAFLQKMYEFQR